MKNQNLKSKSSSVSEQGQNTNVTMHSREKQPSVSEPAQNTNADRSAGIQKLVSIAMLCAVAYVSMALIRLKFMPGAPFLTYDPKDVVITLGGFLFGPLYALCISVIVAFLEMITLSDSGPIGFVMQVVATLAFAGTASLIYRRLHTKRGAMLGLLLGTIAMTLVMLLWNYLLTPLYLGTPRTEVVAMLAPIILPFNMIKGLLNSVILLFIYKPVVTTLRRTGLVPQSR